MQFEFNLGKTAQAAAELLKLEGGSMKYLRLLKLLYIADRESLRETGRPMTGGRFVAMKNGPLLSEVYDLIKGDHFEAADWERFVKTIDGYRVKLVGDPGFGQLSRWEKAKLAKISEEYEGLHTFGVRDLTHEFAEWIKNDPGESSKTIPLEDVLEALGMADRLDDIVQQAKDSFAANKLHSGD